MPETNKLTIYQIKSRFKTALSIVKTPSKSVSIKGIGVFYSKKSFVRQPDWVLKFFNGKLGDIDLYLASAQGVLVTNVTHRKKKVFFVITFGMGRHLINEDAIEEGFGLKVTLNSVDEESIRSIEKSNIGANSKISKEQVSKNSNTSAFGIDIEQDLIRAVTGKSKFPQLGGTISGSDALSVSVKVDISNLKEFLIFCYGRYLSTDYQDGFGWIDQIQHIKNPSLIEKLQIILTKRFNKKEFHKLWMAVPDLMNWSDLKGFKYLPGQKEDLSDDLDIKKFREAVGEIENLDMLHHRYVQAISATTDIKVAVWNIFRCLYGEIEYQTKQFILNNGKWYEIDQDFVAIVNRSYARINISNIELPDYVHENEGNYNLAVSKSNPKFLLMDNEPIFHGGGQNKVEFCDLYSKSKRLVHVKHYGASAVLSHLFQQGMNSGEYFVTDAIFRKKLNIKLKDGWKLKNPDAKLDPEAYEIIFAIISRDDNIRPEIPFFSKVSIKNVQRRLKGYRYKVSLKRIKSLKN